jgi:hypothetical protein
MARSAKQIAAQKKATLASAAKRKGTYRDLKAHWAAGGAEGVAKRDHMRRMAALGQRIEAERKAALKVRKPNKVV